MKTITYTPHLLFRLKLREISYDLPEQVFTNSREKYFDTETEHVLAVGSLLYKGPMREFVVVYEEEKEHIRLITIHPLKPYQKSHRLRSGRWKKI